MARAAAAIYQFPEIAYFLSSRIAALRETGIYVVTGKQFTAAHSDSDLSVLNTVAFFQMELEGSKRPGLSPMS